MSISKELPPVEYLRECFDLVDGSLIRKERPRNHFRTKAGMSIYNSKYTGLIAGKKDKKGYITCRLDYSEYKVHRIIYKMSTGVDPVNKEINHLDFDKSNNKPSNLEMVSGKENKNHYHRSSKFKDGHARSCVPKSSKLNEDLVREIKEMLKNNVSSTEIARKYGVSQPLISQIKRGHRWNIESKEVSH